MAQGKIRGGSGGGDKINGIIEEYVAQGNISAGGFVEYINSIDSGTDTAIINNSANSGYVISAVLLDENKVFIAHGYGGNTILQAIVCTINEESITIGTNIELSSIQYSGSYISAVALSENKVFIAHSGGSRYYLYGMVCTIEGTTITVGTNTSLSSSNYSGQSLSATLLSDNEVFIGHSGNTSSMYLYGMICTISRNRYNC